MKSAWDRVQRSRSATPVLIVIALALLTLAGVRALAMSRTYQCFGGLVSHGPRTAPVVALTFDDGPTGLALDTLLTVLSARDVRVTFFVTGRELAASPEAGQRLVSAGHELGNHTFSHRRMVLIAPGTVAREIESTDSLIRQSGHIGAIDFRPPYGLKLVSLPWYLAQHQRRTITWDIEPDSYRDVAATSEGIVDHVLSRVRPGSIILLHPWYASRATSRRAVGPLVDSLHARGFRVVPVRELLGSGARVALGH